MLLFAFVLALAALPGASAQTTACASQKPRAASGDTLFQLVFMMQTAQDGPEVGDEVRPTAHSWLVDLRVFFSDLCAWAAEPDSPFKRFAPRTIPVTRHTLLGYCAPQEVHMHITRCNFRE
jgi:hypothetical protein